MTKTTPILLLLLVACSGASPSGVPAPSETSAGDPGGTSSTTSPTEPPSSDDPKKADDPAKNDPTVPSAIATAQDCQAYASAFCTKAVACKNILDKIVGAACEERIAGTCVAHLASPGTGYTKAALDACTNAYAGTTLSCADAFGEVTPSACAFKGSLALGAECAFDDQCVTGACSAGASKCGTCEAAKLPTASKTPKATIGEVCDETGKSAPDCDAQLGLWCDGVTKKCAEIPTASLGQSCGYLGGMIVMCAAGGTCKPGTTGSGSCVAEKIAGASCTGASSYNECAFGTKCISGACAYPTAASICN